MSIEVGAKVSGKISGITNFGAFIDLGAGKTGLVHISEISNNYVKDINEVLTVGDEVEVKVMSVGNDGKIGLSIRRASEEVVTEAPRREFPRKEFPRKEFPKPQRKEFRKPSTQAAPKKDDFDSLMSSFLKDSDDRLSSLKRNTEGKRGGRGGRRN